MKILRSLVMLAVAIATGVSAAQAASESAATRDTDARAGQIEGRVHARTLDGQVTTLPEHFEKGKWTLLMVWAADCGICRQEYPMLSQFHDAHKDRDAKVLGVSIDGYAEIERVREYAHSGRMTFDSLVSEVAEIAPIYEAAAGERFTGTPTYMMFNPKGELVAHMPGRVSRDSIESYIREKTP